MGTVNSDIDHGATYSRISHIKDEDQTGVERQERLSLENADRAGITVRPDHRFVDPSKSAWQRNRKRPGWDALIEAIKGIGGLRPPMPARSPPPDTSALRVRPSAVRGARRAAATGQAGIIRPGNQARENPHTPRPRPVGFVT